MPAVPVIRIARPTDRLEPLSRMYREGLGLEVLGRFEDHSGFDGVILGYPGAAYHIEFTSVRHECAGGAPSPEHLLVFYVEEGAAWHARCVAMLAAGFVEVRSSNPYWHLRGSTFVDIDGYCVVICDATWEP